MKTDDESKLFDRKKELMRREEEQHRGVAQGEWR